MLQVQHHDKSQYSFVGTVTVQRNEISLFHIEYQAFVPLQNLQHNIIIKSVAFLEQSQNFTAIQEL